ncbi:mis18-binding protein 1 isoform X4 [Tachysurus vachellii]|uniref:mis18-binding protein 1 isoform X4 n=1 Tax=Tachysurus vachellii TaxID=175792 RepID=UPI00296AADF8|nr:mis18-binding protein 1 isoform X4 [Tachysurus vachellii]
MYVSPAKCPLLHELYYRTPVQTSSLDTPECGMADSRGHSKRLIRNCTTVAMNSTVKDHQIGAESIGAMSCELSTINSSVLSFKRVTDTPAKVFARLKAKVQRLNPEEQRKECVVPVHPDRGVSLSKKILQPLDDDDAASEGQDTYVLTLSPPESTSKSSEDPQIPSILDREPHNPVLGHKPVIVLEKMLTEPFGQVKPQQNKSRMNSRNKSTAQDAYVLIERMPYDLLAQRGPAKPIQLMNHGKNRIAGDHGVFGEMSVRDDLEGAVYDDSNRENTLQGLDNAAQSQPVPQRPEKMSNRQSVCLEAAPHSVPNPMEDSLLQQSPRISIPRKQISAVKSKQQIKEIDKALDGKTGVNMIHLRDWILKLHNKELIVDGIRIDNKIPWHSSCITERVSSNIVKTASGGTYVLVGKMSHYHRSSFPQWFSKKFLCGFPEMWKEYLNKFLMDNEGSGKNRQRNNSAPSDQQKKWPAKQLKSTPVSSSCSVQPHSAPVSRSGRLIKPPLEYWRGGRITVGPDMNVTVHEDYTSTSILLTPKTRPVVILKPLKLPTDQPMFKSPEMKDSSDEDTLAPRRRVKQHKSWRTDGTKSGGNASQKSSHDAVFYSDSGSEKATAKQPSPQKAQSERMYLRKGRSYSRERTSNGSESEVTKFVASAEVGFSAVQTPKGKIKTRLNQKNLQKVIPSEKLSTSSSDSNTNSSQSQIRNIADQVFSPPDSTKRFRRKGSKQKSNLVPPAATMSETEDDTLLHREIEVTKTKNTKRQKKAPKKNENYEMVDAGQESPPSEQKREDKNNSLKSTLKRMQQKQNSGVSERTRNGHIRQVDKHTEQSEKTDNLQPSVPGNTGKKPEPSVSSKRSRRNNKEQTAKHPSMGLDAIDGAWTDQELQKLNEAVNSLPKNKRGYWVNVSLVVGTRSAEECQEQYTTLYQNHGRSKGKRKAKTVKTNEPAIETAPITAKVGTLKRKKQMWEFLDHMPKDDHDDVFAGSPMRNKQIKLPVWSTNGDEPDFGHLQNPQTPSSSMFSSVKTPQCLHITPGMLRSVNRDNNDKYIYHLQKVKRQDKNGRKSSPKDKFTSVLSERKNMKRCVAEDDNFVVWNMLSDKDGPSMRVEEEEEEDDYFMDEY